MVETGPTAPLAAAPAEGRPGVVAEFVGKPLSDLSDVESDKPELGKDILPGPARPAPPNRGERGGNAGGTPLKLEGVFGLLGTANPSGFDTPLEGWEDDASPCFRSGLCVGVLSLSETSLALSVVMDNALGVGNLPPSPDVDGVIGDERAALRGGLEGRGGAGEVSLLMSPASFG